MALMQHQLDRVVKEINRKNLDGLLVAPSEDLVFLVGRSPLLCERFQGLFILPNGDYFYVCNLLTADEMREVLPNRQVYAWFDGDGFIDTVREVFEKKDLLGKTIGVSLGVRAFNILEIRDALDVNWVSARNLCYDARIRKNDDELKGLRGAAKIADKSFMQMFSDIRPGMTEQDVKNILFSHIRENGGVNYRAIVASGPNGSFPHYTGSDRVLQKGDAVVIDFSNEHMLVRSDTTRTIFIGEPTEFQRKIYDIVRRANEAGEAAATNGAWIPDIDKAARDVIEQEGYGQYFTTRLGHGIGYLSHEMPDIKQSQKQRLEPRMAFSIEPGIYLTGDFGVRIEDVVIINEQGETEILNRIPKDYLIVSC